MKISLHAKKRIKQRFGITGLQDIDAFITTVNNPHCYRRSRKNPLKRIVTFRKEEMSVVIDNDTIITVYFFGEKNRWGKKINNEWEYKE